MSNVEVAIEKNENLTIPFYATPEDAGMDIIAAEDTIIGPGETVVVKTGIKVAIPNGYEIQIRPRSGLSLKTPLRVANSPGTIDAGYRNEIGVIITNTSKDYYWYRSPGKEPTIKELRMSDKTIFPISTSGKKDGWYEIKKGDRIAQMVLSKLCRIDFKQVDDISVFEGDRGGGFGSTGTV